MPEIIDTHCHLDWKPLCEDVHDVLNRAREVGVVHCITIGTDLETSVKNVAYAEAHEQVSAAVGVHPNEAENVSDDGVKAIVELSKHPQVVAIGEVGLDFYRDYASPEAQYKTLSTFIELAKQRNLPVIIHCRDAYAELIAVLQKEAQGVQGVIHCASGPPSFIEAALELGFYVSFAGNVTYPSAKDLRELIALVPDDRLLVETDAPFLTPQPKRGQKNEPSFVAHTLEFIAQARQMSPDTLGQITTANARRLFKL